MNAQTHANDGKNIQNIGEYVNLKHLDKVYCKGENGENDILKAEIIDYYLRVAPLILPHIKGKPFSMIHFPEGVGGKSFYQKQCPQNAPEWLKTVPLESSKRGHIDWVLADDVQSIIYMANRSVIEMHTWFSRLPSLETPDIAAIDLDPSGDGAFLDSLILARGFGVLLKELGVFAVPKTSGGSGMHIFIPIHPRPFAEVQEFLQKLCGIIENAYPNLATTERKIEKRGKRVYLDAVQNAFGKTIISPYSLRARPLVPVSTPLFWHELDSDSLKPQDFHLRNIFKRLDDVGDLFQGFYDKAQELPKL